MTAYRMSLMTKSTGVQQIPETPITAEGLEILETAVPLILAILGIPVLAVA